MQTSGTPPRPGCPEGQSLPVEPWEKWPKRKSQCFYNHKYFLVLSYKQLSCAVDTHFPILCLKLKISICHAINMWVWFCVILGLVSTELF